MFQNMKKATEKEKMIEKKNILKENENKIAMERHFKRINQNNEKSAEVNIIL